MSDILMIGFELSPVLNYENRIYLGWPYSNEEFYHVNLIIRSRIASVLETLTRSRRIENISRDISVIIDRTFRKAMIFIDPVFRPDISEVLFVISQAFHGPFGGWEDGTSEFNTIKLTDSKYFMITKIESPNYI